MTGTSTTKGTKQKPPIERFDEGAFTDKLHDGTKKIGDDRKCKDVTGGANPVTVKAGATPNTTNKGGGYNPTGDGATKI